VRKFQAVNGISQVGLVGPVTRAKIQALTCGGGGVVIPPTQALSITGMNPVRGEIGTTVTLSGYGFASNDVIKFGNGAINTINYINQNTISFTIPSYTGQYCPPGQFCTMLAQQVQAGVYSVSVANGYSTSNALNFIVDEGNNHNDDAPEISSLSPSEGPVGTRVTVYGSDLSSVNSVTFSGNVSVFVPVQVENSRRLTFVVPSTTNYQCFVAPCNQQSVSPGSYRVTLNSSYGTSNSVTFYVTSGSTNYGTPTITSISPTSGPIGTQVYIQGSGFNSNSVVEMNGYGVGVIQVNSPKLIYFTVPSYIDPNVGCRSLCGAVAQQVVPGNYSVTVTNDPKYGTSSNALTFIVTGGSSYGNLSISGIDAPTSLPVYTSGTWTVRVNNSGSTYLHYSVVWGDEGYYGIAATAPQSYYTNSATFTHTYQQRGTFAPRFTVTDDYGHSVTSAATINVY
jgi:hypothetical protein